MNLDSLIANIGDYASDAILVTEAEAQGPPGRRVLWCNAAFTRLTGYAREEIVGQTPSILQGADTGREVLDRIRAALAAWQPVREIVKNYAKDGTPFHSELSIRPVADAAGRHSFWVSVQREVTDLVERERHLEARNAALACWSGRCRRSGCGSPASPPWRSTRRT